jgi:hypothetical protein
MNATAKRAAKWWRNVLENRNVGDAKLEENNAAWNLFRFFTAQEESRPTEDLDRFEEILTSKIEKNLEKGDFCIGVDYDPDLILANSAKEAGLRIGFGGWPFKTVMWIDDTKIEVKEGYGAPCKEI